MAVIRLTHEQYEELRNRVAASITSPGRMPFHVMEVFMEAGAGVGYSAFPSDYPWIISFERDDLAVQFRLKWL